MGERIFVRFDTKKRQSLSYIALSEVKITIIAVIGIKPPQIQLFKIFDKAKTTAAILYRTTSFINNITILSDYT